VTTPVSRLTTIDAHAAGGAVRLVTDGFPTPGGETMIEKRRWALRHADALRQTLMLAPRGDADLCGAVLTAPVSPGAHAGLLFLSAEGFPLLSGRAVIAVATIALERGLIMPGGDGLTIVFDTPAGTIRTRARRSREDRPAIASGGGDAYPRAVERGLAAIAPAVDSVAAVLVPSFVLAGGVPLASATRRLRADIAYGGGFFAIVDAESVGVPIDAAHVPELRRAGIEIARAAEAAVPMVHPLDAALSGVRGTVFTGPSAEGRADLRIMTVTAEGSLDRSPSGTGTAAVMTVLDAMGLMAGGHDFTTEGLLGTTFRSRVAGRTAVGDHDAILVETEGSAWLTGDHQWIVQRGDPLAGGFRD
jgi:proline racemase